MADEEQGSQAPDYAGQADLDSLVKAYRASGDEARRQKERADAYERQMQQQYRPQAQASQDPLARFEQETAIPAPIFREALRTELTPILEQILQPVIRAGTARNSILSRHPDYAQFEPQILQYVNSDPYRAEQYGQMLQTNPEAAMEYSIAVYGASKKGEANGAERPSKSDARVPSSRAGESRTQQETGGDQLVDRGREHYNKTGDPSLYAKARIRQAVSDDFLNR